MTSQTPVTFGFVIQADLETLAQSCLSFRADRTGDDLMAVFYGQTIAAFLRGEVSELEARIARVATEHPGDEHLKAACELRLQIRLRTFSEKTIAVAEFLMKEEGAWSGELAMLLGTVKTIQNEYAQAHACFQHATTLLAKNGFIRKSLRAQMNMIVCESHLHPERNLFARYHDLYRQAVKKESRETVVATTCLLNISREYERAGASLAALKFCNRALLLFERQMGELNYYLTLVHRAKLLIALNRQTEAQLDIESAQLADFPEVKAALGDLVKPAQQPARPTLSQLEQKLLQLLARGPRDRIEIVDEIYGERLDHETKQNRFKSLIGTFRKKFPDYIVYEQGRYRLADKILIPTETRVS